jgi:hypothetical protein
MRASFAEETFLADFLAVCNLGGGGDKRKENKFTEFIIPFIIPFPFRRNSSLRD